MSRTQTLGSLNRRDHIRRVHPTCGFLGRGDRIAVLVHVHRFGHVDRPPLTSPPDDGPRLQIIARQNLHASFPIVSFSAAARSEEHTSELQSLMRISYAVFCLQKKKKQK